jgi:hypothetical protein
MKIIQILNISNLIQISMKIVARLFQNRLKIVSESFQDRHDVYLKKSNFIYAFITSFISIFFIHIKSRYTIIIKLLRYTLRCTLQIYDLDHLMIRTCDVEFNLLSNCLNHYAKLLLS